MLNRLVAVCVVAHCHHSHFTYLMYGESVVAVVVCGRECEYRVEHLYELLPSTHQVYEALHVVEYRPCVVPAVALGEVASPLKRREVLLKISIALASAHQVVLLAEQVAVVECALFEFTYLLLGASDGLCHLQYAPVVVGILQRACGTLMYLYVAGNVSQAVVLLVSQTSCR